LLLVLCVLAGSSSAEEATSALEPQALEVLGSSLEFLARAPAFSYTAEIGWDSVQDSGQKIEFGATQRATMRRPDRVRVDRRERDGSERVFSYDGTEITVFNREDDVYARARGPADVDEAIRYTVRALEVPVPLSALLRSDASRLVTKRLESADYVEEATLGGVACDQLAFRNDRVDFQVWIERGDRPLPHRVVITYRDTEGQPQFWANFTEWDLSPHAPDSLFVFEPPESAERIPFAPADLAGQRPGKEESR
jgi:hypothetical protein